MQGTEIATRDSAEPDPARPDRSVQKEADDAKTFVHFVCGVPTSVISGQQPFP